MVLYHSFSAADEAHEFNTEWKSKTKHIDCMLEGGSRYNRPALSIAHGELGPDRSSKRRHPSLSVDRATEPSSHHLPQYHHQTSKKKSRVKFDDL